jgi:hypothetical protein
LLRSTPGLGRGSAVLKGRHGPDRRRREPVLQGETRWRPAISATEAGPAGLPRRFSSPWTERGRQTQDEQGGLSVLYSRLEERDLVANFGQTYRQYQATVPMLIPSPRAVLRQWQSRSAAEPGAPPNGAPATPSGKSEATEGPPSVSRA